MRIKDDAELLLMLEQARVDSKLTKEQQIVRDYVMLQLQRYISRTGKIETHRIRTAIEVVATEGGKLPEVREALLEGLVASHDDRNGLHRRRLILEVVARILSDEGSVRWQREYANRPGAFPQQRALPPADASMAESPFVATILEQGRKATRSDIDYYVRALRNSHHPQCADFLRDVLLNPERNAPSPNAGKWEDNMGGGWRYAKLDAAIGLAELGRPEGMQWLIEKTRPRDVEYELAKQSGQALRALTGSQLDLGFAAWADWFRENGGKFTPNPGPRFSSGMNPYAR